MGVSDTPPAGRRPMAKPWPTPVQEAARERARQVPLSPRRAPKGIENVAAGGKGCPQWARSFAPRWGRSCTPACQRPIQKTPPGTHPNPGAAARIWPGCHTTVCYVRLHCAAVAR